MAGKTGENSSRDPQSGQWKGSLSDTLSRFTTNSFVRRRTAPDLPNTDSPTTAIPRQNTNQPNTTKIPRSSSFFSNLNSFIPRGANSNTKEHAAASAKSLHHSRTYSQRISQPPSAFFNTSSIPEDVIEPLLPKTVSSISSKHRGSAGTQITQRGLMKPITNPPLPRRSTMSNMIPDSSTQTPSFMRPTSSSAARHATPRVASNTSPLPKTVAPIKRRARPSDQIHQPSKLSILSAPTPSEDKDQKESLAVGSPQMSSELDIADSNLPSQSMFQHKEIGSTTHLLAGLEHQDTVMDSGLPSPRFSPVTEINSATDALEDAEYEDTVMDPALPSPLIFQDKESSSTTNLLADLKPEDTNMASDAMLDEDAEHANEGHPKEVTEDPDEELPFIPNPSQITTAQPTGYWLGRVTALSDRFRSEALLSPTSDMHDDGHRMRHVFTYLRGLCATPEAIASFEAFQQQWAARKEGRNNGATGAREASATATVGKKVKEKRGVFEVMMGRKK